MKTSMVAALAALATAASAAPSADVNARQFAPLITFQGAPAETAFFTQSFPGDGSSHAITNPLSISHIKFDGGANCVFYGIDGSVTLVGPGAQTVDVGPPQTQVWGSCRAL